jgi:bifunctional DNase/RNase
MIRVELEEIAVSGDENQFLALLRSPDGEILPIQIDAVQAIAIAAGRSKDSLERPLTHDLMVSVLEMLGVSVTRVEVTELREGTYFALLILERTGVAFEVDARPSDALAIAVRVGAPIFVAPEVLEHSGLRDEFDATGGAQA